MKMQSKYPKSFNFFPETYLFPHHKDQINQSKVKNQIWITKPIASSCGRGIQVVKNLSNFKPLGASIAQKYLKNPFLINGLKFDLRLYVLVTSYKPLRVYFFDNGLTRFATKRYTNKIGTIKDRFRHLTNYSVNKFGDKFVPNMNAEEDDKGSKWSWKGLRRYFKKHKINDKKCVRQIKSLIIKTLIAAESRVSHLMNFAPKNDSCFELYGFDILLDNQLKPWLIEVNLGPSLTTDSPLDKKIKGNLLEDVIKLVQPVEQQQVIDTNEFIKEKNLDTNKFSQDDIKSIIQMEIENKKRGNFRRIFPKQKSKKYLKFFQSENSKIANEMKKV
eukprot:c37171_g1_i1.p1 GENE.c37171_g1_i1~~c37171_g1_i1.p1  ORF type:complete len:331 (+),score=118.47 c37171_g1_i1:441-1433(+)